MTKRGTTQIFYDGNTFTPNEKGIPNEGRKTWKCSQYYKQNCKSRISTTARNGQTFLKINNAEHSHPKLYQTPQQIHNILNYR